MGIGDVWGRSKHLSSVVEAKGGEGALKLSGVGSIATGLGNWTTADCIRVGSGCCGVFIGNEDSCLVGILLVNAGRKKEPQNSYFLEIRYLRKNE